MRKCLLNHGIRNGTFSSNTHVYIIKQWKGKSPYILCSNDDITDSKYKKIKYLQLKNLINSVIYIVNLAHFNILLKNPTEKYKN